MAAALFSVNINVSIQETSGDTTTTVIVPVTLTGNHLEKLNVDVPANTTVAISVPLPINAGIDFIGLAASGASIAVTSDDDDDSHDTFTVVKGQPILYYPGGATPAPFAHRVTRLHLHNADLVKAAVFHMRILRDCTVVGDED
jgi:hypothetical protein